MQLSDEDLQDLTDALFDEADEDGSGAITFEELVGELEKFPGVMENLTMRYIFKKFNCITAKVCEWMNNFIPHFIMDIMNYHSMIGIVNHISKCDPSMYSYPSSAYNTLSSFVFLPSSVPVIGSSLQPLRKRRNMKNLATSANVISWTTSGSWSSCSSTFSSTLGSQPSPCGVTGTPTPPSSSPGSAACVSTSTVPSLLCSCCGGYSPGCARRGPPTFYRWTRALCCIRWSALSFLYRAWYILSPISSI